MSYHILHQFDEAWLAEIAEPAKVEYDKQVRDALNNRSRIRRQLNNRFSVREIVMIAGAIIIALASLMYSVHTSRRADELQRRLDTIQSELNRRQAK